jgi:hypothetical protein
LLSNLYEIDANSGKVEGPAAEGILWPENLSLGLFPAELFDGVNMYIGKGGEGIGGYTVICAQIWR